MRSLLAAFGVALAILAGCAVERIPSASGRFHYEKKVKADLGYLLHVPKDYGTDPAKRWPLVVFLHGSGERGDNLDLVAAHGPPKLAKAGKDLPFVLLSPQCPAGERWQNDVLLALIDRVVAADHIDTNRVYLTGLSMGGYGTWYLGMKHPERFAALAPVCGGGQILDVLLGDDHKTELQRMPVWAFHGAKDNVVPPAESEQMVRALERAGNKVVKHTVYPDAGHDSWTATYDNPEFYAWLLAQSREGRFADKK